MKLYVVVYDKCKYEKDSKEVWSGEYTDVEKFEIKEIPQDEIPQDEILKKTDGSCIDDYNEYLNIYLSYGEIATFRNSCVDVFMIGR